MSLNIKKILKKLKLKEELTPTEKNLLKELIEEPRNNSFVVTDYEVELPEEEQEEGGDKVLEEGELSSETESLDKKDFVDSNSDSETIRENEKKLNLN